MQSGRELYLLYLLQEDNPRCTHPTHLETKSSCAYQWLKDNYPNLKENACILAPMFKKTSTENAVIQNSLLDGLQNTRVNNETLH